MSAKSRATRIYRQFIWFLVAAILLWLAFIAPFVSILSLLKDDVFYAWWLNSMLALPWPFLWLLAFLRFRHGAPRWWLLQYFGVSSVCFSGAIIGVLLSVALPSVMAGKIAIFVCILLCLWAVYCAHQIHVAKLEIFSTKLVKTIRIVQISDIHVGSRSAAFLETVMKLVDMQKPDILVITGDLVDQNVSSADLTPLAGLAYPVFYCSGNHERYIDYQKALENIEKQGVTVLSDSESLCLGIRVLGIEDRKKIADAEGALAKLQASAPADRAPFTVLLYHQPDLWDCAKQQGIDLTLSGHTHNGQIWPFGLLVRTRYRYVAGLFKSASSSLFVSQGTGTWGPIMRLGTRCELTVLELRADNPANRDD